MSSLQNGYFLFELFNLLTLRLKECLQLFVFLELQHLPAEFVTEQELKKHQRS